MLDVKEVIRVAIVGFGPRGLAALEALVVALADTQRQIHVDIFDPCPSPAAGPNYDPAQSPQCILNIPVRAMDIDPPSFLKEQIGSFSQWTTTSHDEDDFPPRADVGAYFNARFESFMYAHPAAFSVTHHGLSVTEMARRDDGWWLSAEEDLHGPYEEVVLTLGQPRTALDAQMDRWHAHAKVHDLTVMHAYPANDLIAAAANWTGKSVAVRGLGLSTFDVLRMLTVGSGGCFEDGDYKPSGLEPRRIMPFSLNGLPPMPKPATHKIDRCFDLTADETQLFEAAVASALSSNADDVLKIICAALVDPALRILAGRADAQEVEAWLQVEREQSGAQDMSDAVEALKLGIEMAHGRTPPSVGYVVGQIWRKWEPIVRAEFDEGDFGVAIATTVVGFDAGLARISAGPPVLACEQLLGLIACDLVTLYAADDPDVTLCADGWQLDAGGKPMTAHVIVDAVIPRPNVAQVTDPLVVSAFASGLVQPLTDNLGLVAVDDGQLVGADGAVQSGLSALGRLAFGSVIAVDSLHDCFGASTKRWAVGVKARLNL